MLADGSRTVLTQPDCWIELHRAVPETSGANSGRLHSHRGPPGSLDKFMRMLASVYANHDSKPSNPNQVMVIMFGVELSAVDKAHWYLKSFVERRVLLQFRRGLQECLNEARPARLEFPKSFSH